MAKTHRTTTSTPFPTQSKKMKALCAELEEVARHTGRPITTLFERALDNFLEDEAPVLAQAAPKKRATTQRPCESSAVEKKQVAANKPFDLSPDLDFEALLSSFMQGMSSDPDAKQLFSQREIDTTIRYLDLEA